jgi:uncharacterized protein (TIGR02217 family)
MTFRDIPFPDCIAFGAQSDVVWLTNIVQSIGGYESANQNWEDAKHAYDVSFAVRTVSDYQAIRAHFNQVRGRANTFPFKDYLDFEVTAANGVLLTSAGAAPSANGTVYLHKRYGSGGSLWDRQITRPDTTLTAVTRTRSGTPSNILGTDAVVTYTTGAVALTNHMSGDTYTWAGSFKVPCRYDVDRLPAAIINKQPGQSGELLVDVQSIPIVEVRE